MQFIIELNEKNFLINSIVGYNIVEYCDFLEWAHGEKKYQIYFGLIGRDRVYECIKDAAIDHRVNPSKFDYSKLCPIGSVNFTNYILGKSGHRIKPINIPIELSDYSFTHREIARGKYDVVNEMLDKYENVFIKPDDNAKEFEAYILRKKDFDNTRYMNNYFVSEVVNFTTEWRVLVRNKKPIYISTYNGDIHDNIDWNFVNKCIDAYKNCPKSYALDIGKTDNGEYAVVEVNNFIACGAYGYSDKDLIKMVIDGWNYEMAQ